MSPPTWASIAGTSTGTTTAAAPSSMAATSVHHGAPAASSSSASNPMYQRKDGHRPRTIHDEEDLYILSLLTDAKHHTDMSALRRKWFPEKLLKVDAHITLFHALPGSRLEDIKGDIGNVASREERFEVRVGRNGVFRMGKGVGVEMDRNSLERVRSLREGLRSAWQAEGQDGEGWLSEQDARKGWKGHYTVMNKENDRDRIEECYTGLKEDWSGSKGVVTGLSLWRTITVLLALVAEIVVSQVSALPNQNETTASPTHIALEPHTTSTAREPIAIEALSTSLIPDTEGKEPVPSRSQDAVHKIALREGGGSTVGSPKSPYRKPLSPNIVGLGGAGGGFRGEGGIVPIYDPLCMARLLTAAAPVVTNSTKRGIVRATAMGVITSDTVQPDSRESTVSGIRRDVGRVSEGVGRSTITIRTVKTGGPLKLRRLGEL
ncbi:hypothetical protein SCUP515_09614 [Seiridium cupressi]